MFIVEIALPSDTHNVYISPSITDWTPEFQEIKNILSIIAGDYNARAHLWDDIENPSGKLLQDWYFHKRNKFKLLNSNCEHTTIHYSTPALTFVSNAFNEKCAWCVNNDILSDIHYGIEITLGLQNYCKEADFIPRYKLYETDWESFSMALDSIMQGFDVASINTLRANDIATLIADHFIKAADETVTKTKYCKTSWRCWYWNDECTKYKRFYRQALTEYNDKRYPRRETRPIMKAAKAVTYEMAKRAPWERIVHKLE